MLIYLSPGQETENLFGVALITDVLTLHSVCTVFKHVLHIYSTAYIYNVMQCSNAYVYCIYTVFYCIYTVFYETQW